NGEFQPDEEPEVELTSDQHNSTQSRTARQYAVGQSGDEFVSLVGVDGDWVDDLCLARRFSSIDDALTAAETHVGNVFEIVRRRGRERLRQLTVDLELAQGMPFDGCYLAADELLVGPNILSPSDSKTEERAQSIRAGLG